ncbi:MAG TPA: DinB family protein [Chloroflexia bacterium]|nr:DinB family protein [Chloroflexia bacterium]
MSNEAVSKAATQAHEALVELEKLLGQIPDVDLHRAEPNGGWTCAQVVSHIHLSGLLWIADLERLSRHREPHMFMFREELGHDAVGAPPPSAEEAARRIASVRTALDQYLAEVDPAILDIQLEVPTLGTFTVAEWMPLITGHIAGHVGQLKAILRSRDVLPAAFAESEVAV